MNCTCEPGTWENGWHELRCKNCREAEWDVWRKMLAAFRDADTYYISKGTDRDRAEESQWPDQPTSTS